MQQPGDAHDTGLAFFYGGLVHRRNVLGIMIQSFVSMGWTSVIWFAFGYSMCFGPSLGGIIGNPTTHAFLRGITLNSLFAGDANLGIPTSTRAPNKRGWTSVCLANLSTNQTG